MLMGLFLTLLALVGIIAIMVWIVQLPFVALLINIGLIALAAGIVQGPLVALLAIIGFVAAIVSALRWATTQDTRSHRIIMPDVVRRSTFLTRGTREARLIRQNIGRREP